MTSKRPTSPDSPLCRFAFADGRHCALPAAPHSNGLCYHHAHAPHRRLRPSDLTRELASSPSGTVPEARIHRLLAKLPTALADGTISLEDFRVMRHLCSVMLECSRLSANELPTDPHDLDWNFIASVLNDHDDDNHNHQLHSPSIG